MNKLCRILWRGKVEHYNIKKKCTKEPESNYYNLMVRESRALQDKNKCTKEPESNYYNTH